MGLESFHFSSGRLRGIALEERTNLFKIKCIRQLKRLNCKYQIKETNEEIKAKYSEQLGRKKNPAVKGIKETMPSG